jgi:CHAT domain-containing protein
MARADRGGPAVGSARSLSNSNDDSDVCVDGKLNVPAGSFVSLTIDRGDIPLSASVVSPEEKPVISVTSRSRASIPLFFRAASAGEYRLKFWNPTTHQSVDKVRCRNLSIRQALPDDDEIILAGLSYVEGTNLAWRETANQLQKSDRTLTGVLSILATLNQSDHLVTSLLAKTLIAHGAVLNDLSDPEKALAPLQHAADIARTDGDRPSEASALAELSRSQWALGKVSSAFEYAESALTAAKAADAAGMACAYAALADISYETNDYTNAREYAGQALNFAQRALDQRGQAHALITVGLIESDLNHSDLAKQQFAQALSLSKQIDYLGGTVDVLTYLGHLNSKEGQLREAIDLYSAAEKLGNQLGDKLRVSWIMSGKGYVYDQIGDANLALKYYQDALTLRLAVRNVPAEGSIYRRLGAEYFSLGKYAQADYYLTKAIGLYQEFKQWRYLAVSLRDMGQIAEAKGDKSRAADLYSQAAEAMEKAEDQRSLAYLLMANGRLQESQGNLNEAFANYERALKLHHSVTDPRGESEARFRMALVSIKREQLTSALEQLEAAVRSDESFRSNIAGPDLRASFSADVRTHYESYVDLIMQMGKRTSIGDNWTSRAFEANERGRGRSFIETLAESHAEIREGVDVGLVNEERAILRELNARIEDHRLIGYRSEQEAAILRQQIDRLKGDYDLIEERIRANSPRYAALTNPAALATGDIQKLLDSETVLLEYALGNQRSYVWAVTRGSVQAYELPGRKEIEKQAERITTGLSELNHTVKNESAEQWQRRLNQAQADYSEASTALSRMIIEPVAPLLGNKRLVIVADGSLQRISFQALPAPRTSAALPTKTSKPGGRSMPEERLLIHDHEIVYEPSASVLALQRNELANRKPARYAVAVLANPVFDRDDPRVKSAGLRGAQNRSLPNNLPAGATAQSLNASHDVSRALEDIGLNRFPLLRSSELEAESIMSVAPKGEVLAALNFKASRATATSPALSQYRIIHFATHGVVDFENPDLSGVVLSMVDEKGQPQDGYLRLHDIYNLNLPADLIVLSACETGVGRELKGEGLIALTRGFMYAGAARVVASLWKVDDVATAELMTEFYKQMFGGGLAPAAALRAAQLKLSHQSRWRSPYYWAGFVLQGEWK